MATGGRDRAGFPTLEVSIPVYRRFLALFSLALLTAGCGSAGGAGAPTWTFPPSTRPAPATAAGSPTASPLATGAAPADRSGSPVATDDPATSLALAATPSGSPQTSQGSTAAGAAASAPATASVRIANFSFGPGAVTVRAGGRVTWTNADGDRHSVLLGGSESPRLGSGATYSRSFATPGRFTYVCGIHSSMTGSVTVLGAGASSVGAATPATGAGGSVSPAASSAGDDGDDDGGRDDDDRDHEGDDDHSGPGGGNEGSGRDEDHSGPGGGGSGPG